MGEGTGYYEKRGEELGEETMRQIERQVMLRLIDGNAIDSRTLPPPPKEKNARSC